MAPEPEAVFSSVNLAYSAMVERAVLQGKVNANVDLQAFYSL